MKLAKIVPIPRGTYSATATYNSLDIVRYNGATYICCADNITNITPSDGVIWKLIVEDGNISAQRWENVTDKPFETVGAGLSVNSNNELTADVDSKYGTSDSASTTIADTDYFPYSTNTTKKKALWTTILNKIKSGLGTAAQKDVPVSGNASTSQIVMGNDTRLTDSRNAKDVYSWAKASSKPSYSYNEILNKPTVITDFNYVSGTGSKTISIPVAGYNSTGESISITATDIGKVPHDSLYTYFITCNTSLNNSVFVNYIQRINSNNIKVWFEVNVPPTNLSSAISVTWVVDVDGCIPQYE